MPVILVPTALIMAVLGPPLAQAVFGHGSTSAASARYLGVVFAVFALGLLPYTVMVSGVLAPEESDRSLTLAIL